MFGKILVSMISVSFLLQAQEVQIDRYDEQNLRISEDARTITQTQVSTQSLLNMQTADLTELSTIAVLQVELLKNNKIGYSSLLVGLISFFDEAGNQIDTALVETQQKMQKVSKKKMRQLRSQFRKLKQQQDRMDHFVAYLRALTTCIEMVPVANETLQISTMGIQSQWCQDMRKTQEAKDVGTMLGLYSWLTKTPMEETTANRQVIVEAIESLVKTGYIKMKK